MPRARLVVEVHGERAFAVPSAERRAASRGVQMVPAEEPKRAALQAKSHATARSLERERRHARLQGIRARCDVGEIRIGGRFVPGETVARPGGDDDVPERRAAEEIFGVRLKLPRVVNLHAVGRTVLLAAESGVRPAEARGVCEGVPTNHVHVRVHDGVSVLERTGEHPRHVTRPQELIVAHVLRHDREGGGGGREAVSRGSARTSEMSRARSSARGETQRRESARSAREGEVVGVRRQ